MAVVSCTSRPATRHPDSKEHNTLNRYSYAKILMGSRCKITLFAPNEAQAATAAAIALDEVARIEHILTDYNPNSEAMQVMRMPLGQWHEVSPTLMEILVLSKKVHRLSNGAFDPTIGAMTHLWRRVLKEGRIPTEAELNLAKASSGFEHLEMDQTTVSLRFEVKGMILDFGGIGKGYAADRAIEVLARHGFKSAMVDLGGDLVFGDPPPDRISGWEVEIQTGISAHKQMLLSNCGVATSGDLERHFTFEGIRYSHIIDPSTGIGLTKQHAVTVVSMDGTTADSLASAYSVLGNEELEKLTKAFPHTTVQIVTPLK